MPWLTPKRNDSVAIGHLERFVADYERETGQVGIPRIAPPTGKAVASGHRRQRPRGAELRR